MPGTEWNLREFTAFRNYPHSTLCFRVEACKQAETIVHKLRSSFFNGYLVRSLPDFVLLLIWKIKVVNSWLIRSNEFLKVDIFFINLKHCPRTYEFMIQFFIILPWKQFFYFHFYKPNNSLLLETIFYSFLFSKLLVVDKPS